MTKKLTTRAKNIIAEYSQPAAVTNDQIALIASPIEDALAQIAATFEEIGRPDLADKLNDPTPIENGMRFNATPEEILQSNLKTFEPTPDEISAALATIDAHMETAAVAGEAGVADWHNQRASWVSPELAAEEIAVRELETAVAGEMGENVETFALDQARARIDDESASKMVWKIKNAIDDREKFEIDAAEAERADPNPNILRTLKKLRDQMVTLRAAKLMCAIRVEPDFINRSINGDFRYNVYAMGKLGDVIYGVTDGMLSNAINLACLKTLFAFKKVEETFTMEVAKSCCSKQYALKKLGAAIRAHLISHTVSESTAPTQASSTMQALTTLGVVKCNGSGKNAIYTLTDAPIVAKLEAMLKAA